MAWNQLIPGLPAVFDSTRQHAIAAHQQATILVLYSARRELKPETVAHLERLGFPSAAGRAAPPLDVDAQTHTIEVHMPDGLTHVIPWRQPQMVSNLWTWLCRKYKNMELAWTTWDKPAPGSNENLLYYAYHDVIVPGSVVCARPTASVPATDPRCRGGANPKVRPEMLTWEGKLPTQMLQLQTVMMDEDNAPMPQVHISAVTDHTRAVVLVNWGSWSTFSTVKSDGVLVALLPGDKRFDDAEPQASKVSKQEVVLMDAGTGKRFPRLVTVVQVGKALAQLEETILPNSQLSSNTP
eukprot:2282090-Amphidinium_carterae.1